LLFMIASELKTAAETLRRRLDVGLRTLEEAQAWADDALGQMQAPPAWLVDVSMARTSDDAQAALARVEGEADAAAVWAAVMADWLAVLDAQPERDSEIGRALFYLAEDGDVPAPEARGEMYGFWDSIDLAKDGFFAAIEAERAKLRAFLVRWSGGSEPPAAGGAPGSGSPVTLVR
jgi:hypothetical protein